MSQYLQSKLASVRAKHSLVATGMGSSHLVVLGIAWLGGMMIIDRLFELPWIIRAIMLLGGLVLLGWSLLRWSILPIVRSPDDEELALAVERDRPEFSTRLIAAIQFSRPEAIERGASASLARVTVQEAETMAGPLNFNAVIKTDRLLKAAGVAFLVLLLGTGTYVWGGDRTSNLLKRALLSADPLLTRTSVIDETGITKVAQGDEVVIVGRAKGYVPSKGRVVITSLASNKSVEYAMAPRAGDESAFTVSLGAVQESFKYQIFLYDGRSEEATIQVMARPTITRISCIVTYPAYTLVAPMPRPIDNLQVLPGSKLQLTIETNKPLALEGDKKTAVHRFAGDKESGDTLMTVDPSNHRKAVAEVPVTEGLSAFNFRLVDEDGLTNKDPAVYRVEIVPDRSPTVHLTWPDRKEILATKFSVEDIGFMAEDDYMIGKLALKYRVDEGDIKTIPITTQLGRTAQDMVKWDLSKVEIPTDENGAPKRDKLEGSAIEYWIEVTDTNNTRSTGPGVGISDKYQIRIVSKEEKQAELMSRLSESMGHIEDITGSQENASNELSHSIPGSETQPAPH